MPGLGQLGLVLLEQAVGLGLSLRGPLQPALDLVGPLLQGLADPGQQHLPQREEDDEERDRADDDLGPVRDERVLQATALTALAMQHVRLPLRPDCYLMKNGTAMPMRASDSVSAKPIHIRPVTRPAASGWRAIDWIVLPKIRPMPMPGPMAARP